MKNKHQSRGQKKGNTSEESEFEEKLLDAIQTAEAGHPDRALAELGRLKLNTDAVRNARGVCLLRMGKYEEAVQLFRRLVLAPGCTWMKLDLPVIYRTNFCTALLLGGHPAGCQSCLSEIAERSHPSVIRLHAALKQWERSLPWWPRLLWKLGVEPDVPIEMESLPGEFFEPSLEPPAEPRKDGSLPQAA
jgi:hypothetical protein